MDETLLAEQLKQERARRKLAEDALRRTNAVLDGIYSGKRWKIACALAKLTGSRGSVSYETVLPWDCTTPPVKPELAPEITDGHFPVIPLPETTDPLVSIVIPVYNNFHLTYRCIESIVKNSGSISYEIILADDCSTDETCTVSEIFPGIRHVRNETNLRFLRNCNNAARYAVGKYILFLNNDTQVMPNWLSPLVELMERDPKTGMVGSKLIYPDGRLQEAGGIVWNDGTAWNYGNGGNPADPEFNYVKEADYISGASILLPRALWETIGGFDERFVPAYCEDSDLAFTVRSLGYRVLYQPKSVVVHFEGMTNGTDTSGGQKAYQLKNTAVFREKWAAELQQHAPGGTCVFLAKDRSLGKETVLVKCRNLIQADATARALVQQGANVKLLPADGQLQQPCAAALQQLGIELLRSYDHSNDAYIDRCIDLTE